MAQTIDTIFNLKTTLEVDEQFVLKPIIEEFLNQEAVLYAHNSETSGIKQSLPDFYVSSQQQAKEKLQQFIKETQEQKSVLYCVRFKDFLAPIGYIYLERPTNKEDTWKVKIWINGSMQKKGIMTKAIKSMIPLLKDLSIDKLDATVASDNQLGSKIFEKMGFKLIDSEHGVDHYQYAI
ncbi:GNAT family N-acetyltransferase [Myroides injenensis]|uniref:GNAT family N-acetyltransferase n=1 Tax=Myroides injenensis TaxID=1183151 RepID=UPI00028856F2|nr:GNAT family protein [Myroides injenensis]